MKTNSKNNSKTNVNASAIDDMQKQVLKAEKAAAAAARATARLEKATNRLEALKNGRETVGFANQTLSVLHASDARAISVQGAIDALNTLIKRVATANGLTKPIVAALKGEAAQTILQQLTDETLPLYVDNKGQYKVEGLYRLVASKAKNNELRTVLNNLQKENNK